MSRIATPRARTSARLFQGAVRSRATPAVLVLVLMPWLRATSQATPVPIDSVEAILRRYVADYAIDPSLREDITFGVYVGPEHWHVMARARRDSQPADVRLIRGEPPQPTFYFTLDYPTLVRIDRGEINALTAMVRGLSSDRAPMSTGSPRGFTPGEGFVEKMLAVSFHFWTRGLPEVIPYGPELTRFVHGTDAVVLYYGKGIRTGWFSLKKGQHANADPRLQVNPFPTLLILTSGRGAGRIGGEQRELQAGNAVLVPAGVSHEFWNPHDEPVEGFLIMFGPGV